MSSALRVASAYAAARRWSRVDTMRERRRARSLSSCAHTHAHARTRARSRTVQALCTAGTLFCVLLHGVLLFWCIQCKLVHRCINVDVTHNTVTMLEHTSAPH